jgi:hypothetical protein
MDNSIMNKGRGYASLKVRSGLWKAHKNGTYVLCRLQKRNKNEIKPIPESPSQRTTQMKADNLTYFNKSKILIYQDSISTKLND